MKLDTLEFTIERLVDFHIGPDYKNDSGIDPHFHPYWELKVYEDEMRPRMVMTPPDSVHGQTKRNLLATGWILHCREPMLNLTFHDLDTEKGMDFLLDWKSADALSPGGLMGLIETMRRVVESGDLPLLNLMQRVLWGVVNHVRRDSQDKTKRPLSPLEMAEYHIERNYYHSSLSVEEVAYYTNVTPGHLANLFKKAGKTTVRGRIVEIRMNQALRLLRSGRHTVGEVAEMTGWSCQFYFSNCFRRRFGVPPSKAVDLICDDNSIA